MTVTTLEPLEFIAPDITIGCDNPEGCPESAAYVIRSVCKCVRLRCVACTARLLFDMSRDLGREWECRHCGYESPGPVLQISDFVESVQPL